MNGVTSSLVSFYDFNVSSYFAMRKSISIYRKIFKYFRDIFIVPIDRGAIWCQILGGLKNFFLTKKLLRA